MRHILENISLCHFTYFLLNILQVCSAMIATAQLRMHAGGWYQEPIEPAKLVRVMKCKDLLNIVW